MQSEQPQGIQREKSVFYGSRSQQLPQDAGSLVQYTNEQQLYDCLEDEPDVQDRLFASFRTTFPNRAVVARRIVTKQSKDGKVPQLQA